MFFTIGAANSVIKSTKKKKKIVLNHFYNILRLLDVLPILPFTTSKRCAIITLKHDICKLPHELPNDLRLRILGN